MKHLIENKLNKDEEVVRTGQSDINIENSLNRYVLWGAIILFNIIFSYVIGIFSLQSLLRMISSFVVGFIIDRLFIKGYFFKKTHYYVTNQRVAIYSEFEKRIITSMFIKDIARIDEFATRGEAGTLVFRDREPTPNDMNRTLMSQNSGVLNARKKEITFIHIIDYCEVADLVRKLKEKIKEDISNKKYKLFKDWYGRVYKRWIIRW